MIIIRTPRPLAEKPETDAVVSIPTGLIVEDGLSWAARGVLSYLLSFDDSAEIEVSWLADMVANSVKPTSTQGMYFILREIEKRGYLIKKPEFHRGKFVCRVYYVFDSIEEADKYREKDAAEQVRRAEFCKGFE